MLENLFCSIVFCDVHVFHLFFVLLFCTYSVGHITRFMVNECENWKSLVPIAWNSFIRSFVRPFVHWLWKMNDDEHTSNLISISFILSNTQFTLLYFFIIIITIIVIFFMPFHFLLQWPLHACILEAQWNCIACNFDVQTILWPFIFHWLYVLEKWSGISFRRSFSKSTCRAQKRCNFELVPYEKNKRKKSTFVLHCIYYRTDNVNFHEFVGWADTHLRKRYEKKMFFFVFWKFRWRNK